MAWRALRDGVVQLLQSAGENVAAACVAQGTVSPIGAPEPWTINGRSVDAQRVVLTVDAPTLTALANNDALSDAIRRAFEAAMRTPATALASLAIVLRLPEISVGWHDAYRTAPRQPREDPPSPERVLRGAERFLAAQHDTTAAALLGRADLTATEVGQTNNVALFRYVLRLTPEDLAAIEANPEIGLKVSRAVSLAATRAESQPAFVGWGLRDP